MATDDDTPTVRFAAVLDVEGPSSRCAVDAVKTVCSSADIAVNLRCSQNTTKQYI